MIQQITLPERHQHMAGEAGMVQERQAVGQHAAEDQKAPGWRLGKMCGSLNVPIEHHPTNRYMVYNGYYKVMSKIPKMGQLPTPEMDANHAKNCQER